MKELFFFIAWFLCLSANAQRLSFGMEYELYPFNYLTPVKSFKGDLSGNTYEVLGKLDLENSLDTTRESTTTRSSGSFVGSLGYGFSIGIKTGIHRRKWAIKTGINWSYEALNFGLISQENPLDTFQVVNRRSSVKIPLKYQHSLLLIKQKDFILNFLLLEVGLNYVIPLGSGKSIPYLIRGKDKTRIVDEILPQDAKSLFDFYNNPYEIVLGIGFMGLGRGQLIFRDKIYLGQGQPGWVHFHNFGIAYSNDIMGKRLLRKRKKLYKLYY